MYSIPFRYQKHAWVLVLLTFLAIVLFGFRYSANRLSDFAGYYTSAKLLASSDSLSYLYDDAWFVKKANEFGIRESTFIMYVNPPPVSVVMFSLQKFEPFTAKFVWNCFTLILLGFAYSMLRRQSGLHVDPHLGPIILGVLACTIPFLRNLQRGQIYVLMLVLVLLMLRGIQEKNVWLTSIPLSLLILLKYFGWMFFALLLVERRWREIVAAVFLILLGFGIGVIVFGTSTYIGHFERLAAAISGNDFALTGLPSIQAFWGALFSYDSRWNPDPVVDVSWLAHLLTFASLGTALFFSLKGFASVSNQFHVRAHAILILSVIFTPLAADHHYVLLVPPILFLIQFYDREKSTTQFILIFSLIYATLGWFPHLSISEFAGWGKLLCFIRLFGAIGVFILVLRSKPPAREAMLPSL